MHVFFSGIGGTAIGPLALIAKQAGYTVSGSDKQDSDYIKYLQKLGVSDIHIGQSREQIEAVHAKNPIDWYVQSSAVAIEQPDSPELAFCEEKGIKTSKRDELINQILEEKQLKMIAIAGTHGKTTTTAMAVWLFKRLGVPISYSVGAKISFGEMGQYEPGSEYFIYEADEYDRNFLSFKPHFSIISGLDWDHPDIYPTREEYNKAFRQFLGQSEQAIIWREDADLLELKGSDTVSVVDKTDYAGFSGLAGRVNREDAAIVARAAMQILGKSDLAELEQVMQQFPGLSRRFEKIAENIYTDYAHTPAKIRGALQLAEEVAGDNVVVVYEGLHNTRQHFIRHDLGKLFGKVKKLYVVPSYLAREDESLELWTPEKLCGLMHQPAERAAAQLDEGLKSAISDHAAAGDLVLALSAGGGGSLDEWLRGEFKQ